MARTREDLIDTIQRLLALSGSPNEHEARAALAKAQELMLRHQLSMSDVEREEVSRGGYTEEPIWDGRRAPMEMEFVVSILTRFFCVCAYREGQRIPGRRRKPSRRIEWTVRIFGRPDQVAVARHVYVYLSRTFRRLWDGYKRDLRRYTYSDARTYCAGLYDGLAARLLVDGAVQLAESDGENALAVVGRDLVEAFRAGPGAGLKPRRTTPIRGSEPVFEAGYRDGSRIELRRPLESPMPTQQYLFSNGSQDQGNGRTHQDGRT